MKQNNTVLILKSAVKFILELDAFIQALCKESCVGH